jgi:hypothetical protein
MDEVKDPRFAPAVVYPKRFLLGGGLTLFLGKLGSRRQLDYQLNTDGPELLANLNRLAGAAQASRPVNKTLEYFLGKVGSQPIAGLRQKALNRLIRSKALDSARLPGRFVALIGGSGYLVFRYKHCDHCLTRRHGDAVLYLHQVLEAKLVGPAGTVFSIATEFIDNRDAEEAPAGASQDRIKQDCELKAFGRLLPKLRADFPQLRVCLGGDGLFACGRGFQAAKDYKGDYAYTFQPGRMPALWRDFQGLLALCPDQRVELSTGLRRGRSRPGWTAVRRRRLAGYSSVQAGSLASGRGRWLEGRPSGSSPFCPQASRQPLRSPFRPSCPAVGPRFLRAAPCLPCLAPLVRRSIIANPFHSSRVGKAR